MKQKGFAPILIVLLIALGIGGYLFYTNYSNNRSNQTKPSQAPEVTIQTPQPTPASTSSDETSTWKTYTSPNGYTIKYPADATFNTQVSNDTAEFEIKNKTMNVTFWKPVVLPNNMTIDDFINSPGLGPSPVQTKISGAKLDGADVQRYEGTQNGEYIIKIGVPIKGKEVFEIRAYPAEGSNANLENLKLQLDQILSTFKFTQ